MAIPKEDEDRLLQAVTFTDDTEYETVIAAARSAFGENSTTVLKLMLDSADEFGKIIEQQFKTEGGAV